MRRRKYKRTAAPKPKPKQIPDANANANGGDARENARSQPQANFAKLFVTQRRHALFLRF